MDLGELSPLLEKLSAEAQTAGIGLYMVGGVVRDLLLNKTNTDLDLVVEGDAINFVQKLSAKFGGKVDSYTAFRTATWFLSDEVLQNLNVSVPASLTFIDFATARTETYPEPAALPVVTPSTIDRDLFRRDFTINAMAIRLAPAPFGTLIDLYNGQDDLKNGVIRVLHDQSLIDDPTRIFRAVRFMGRLKFGIDEHTQKLMREALPYISRLSGERIRHEIELCFVEDNVIDIFHWLNEWVLQAIAPNLKLTRQHWSIESIKNLPTEVANLIDKLDKFAVLWLVFLYDIPGSEAIAQRLGLSRTVMNAIEVLPSAKETTYLIRNYDMPVSETYNLLKDFSDELLMTMCLWSLDIGSRIAIAVGNYFTKWRHIRPKINGNDLVAMGLKPGPRFGKLLSLLRDAWLDGKINNEAEERTYLEHLLAQEENEGKD